MNTPTPASPVSLVIACFNTDRAGTLTPLLARLGSLRTAEGHGWDVIFVDDGSTDGTFGTLLGAARRDSWVKVLRHPARLGTGAALRTGFAHARSPVVCTIDDRGAYPPERLPDLVALVHGGADIAVGIDADASGPAGDDDGRRQWLGRVVVKLYARLTGRDGRTLTSPFRAYRRAVLDRIRFRAGGVTALAEIMMRAGVSGYRVHELPVSLATRANTRGEMTDALVAHAGLLVLTASMLSAREARRLARTATRGGR